MFEPIWGLLQQSVGCRSACTGAQQLAAPRPALPGGCRGAASRDSGTLRAGIAFQALAGSPERRGAEPINAVELQNTFSGNNNNKQRLS